MYSIEVMPETAEERHPAPAEERRPCSKCGGELDTTAYPKWCRKCRAANKREYEATRKEMTESRGYACGVTAMKHHLAQHFSRLGSGSFSGYECAQLIMQSEGPK